MIIDNLDVGGVTLREREAYPSLLIDAYAPLAFAFAFAAYMAKEQARWGEVVRRAGARLD